MIELRGATEEDIPFLASMTYEAMLPPLGVGLFDHALATSGTPPVDFIERLIAHGLNQWSSLGDYLVLLANGERVGSAGSYRRDLPDWRPLDPDALGLVADDLGWDAPAHSFFVSSYTEMFGGAPRPGLMEPHADYIIEYVGILGPARGKGYVRHLLSAHLARARDAGLTSVGISTIQGNDHALHAYRRFGFETHQCLTAEDFGGVIPGLNRLRLELR